MTDATIVDDELHTGELTAEEQKTSGSNEERTKGLVLVTCTDPTLSAFALAAIANGILANCTVASLPVVPVSAITFVYAAGSRDAESIKSYASKHIQAGKLQAKAIEDCRRLDSLCPGGVPHVTRYLTAGTCVLATAEHSAMKRDDAIAALVDLNAAAVERGALVIIFVQHTKKQDVTWLREYCATAIEVRKCEPGPGALVAFVLDNLTLASDHMLGIGRVMVEAFRDLGGNWTYRLEPFIAERAIIRLAWYLVHEGMTLRAIEKIVGISASNISRGFQALLIQPKNAVGLAPPTGWRTRWADCYDLPEEKTDVKQEPVGTPSNTVSPLRTHQQDTQRSNSVENASETPAALPTNRVNRKA